MSKRPSKRITPGRPKLKQSRLAGVNEGVKSVRRRPSLTASDSGLKQSSLANFGFQKMEGQEEAEPEETPVRKKPRRRRFLPDDEIAETQFALMTQSCYVVDDDDGHDMKKEEGEEGMEKGEGKEKGEGNVVVMGVGMPPPPVTPKRKRVLEVPSSHSPPATPFTPFSQRKDVAVDRLSPSPGANGNHNSKDLESPERSAAETRVIPFKTHAATGVKMQMNIKVEDDEETASEEEPGAKASEKSREDDRNRVVKSSQWWENEELTQRSSLAILVAGPGPEREHAFKSTLDDDDNRYEERQKYEQAYILEDAEPEDTGGQLSKESLEEADHHHFLDERIQSYETPGLEDTPAPRVGDVKEVEVNTTTTLIPINFHDDSPEPLSPAPSSTQDEEDEDEDEDAFHEFKPVRTQQFPSSYFHRGSSSPPSPDLPPSSQFLSEPSPPDELGGSCDGDNDNYNAQNGPMAEGAGGGSGGIPLTVSQLLPSSLMETFPMPPPLSQYDSDEYEFGLESETQ